MSDVHKRIQAVCKEYETSLEDLTFNSRVLIQSLTLLADKSKVYAPYIVQIVEKRITKVSPDQKLPILYLLDSIMKNLGGEYLQLFSKNIVATFCHTFEKVVDPKKRLSLFKLRQTWNAIIPVRKLVAIDKHVHSIDNAWPVAAESPPTPQSPTIFVNPKFVKPDGELASQTVEESKNEVSGSSQSNDTITEESKQGTIQEQRKALLEQQRQKRFEREKQLGLHKNTSSETPLKPAITKGPNSKRNGTPKHVRFSDNKQVGVGPVPKKIKRDEDILSVPSGSQDVTKMRSTSPIHIRPSMLNLDDLPEELIAVHQERIKQQVDREYTTGRINRVEHTELVEDIDKYYELQKKKLAVSDKVSPPANDETKSLPANRTAEQISQPMETQSVNSTVGIEKIVPIVDKNSQTSSILEQASRPVNVPDLLSKLVQTGLLPQQQQQQQQQREEQPQPPVSKAPTNTSKPVNPIDEHLPPAIRLNPNLLIPNLEFKISHLKQFYPSLLELMYAGEQCSQCGLRFVVVPSKEYSDHLDWHFQQNRRDKDGLRKTSRNWFLHPDDWYNLKEGEQIEDKAKSSVFEQEQLEDDQRADEGNSSCKVLLGEGNEACHLCGEVFEQFWEEDLEEWHFKDAVRTSEGSLYHTDCQKEAKDSEVPTTPVTPLPMDIEISR